MSDGREVFTIRVHTEPGELMWPGVEEVPGVFASGEDFDELPEAVAEALSLVLPGQPPATILSVAEDKVEERRVAVACG